RGRHAAGVQLQRVSQAADRPGGRETGFLAARDQRQLLTGDQARVVGAAVLAGNRDVPGRGEHDVAAAAVDLAGRQVARDVVDVAAAAGGQRAQRGLIQDEVPAGRVGVVLAAQVDLGRAAVEAVEVVAAAHDVALAHRDLGPAPLVEVVGRSEVGLDVQLA